MINAASAPLAVLRGSIIDNVAPPTADRFSLKTNPRIRTRRFATQSDTELHLRLEHLAHDLDRFRAFVRGRVRDPHLADEVLQDAFARAARAIDQLTNDEHLDAWFYRILRNRIADRAQTPGSHVALRDEPIALERDEHHVCQCFHHLLDRLPDENAEALRLVDLAGASSETVAAHLGMTANVRRHRGRQQLRTLLSAACGMCASDGCRDCQC